MADRNDGDGGEANTENADPKNDTEADHGESNPEQEGEIEDMDEDSDADQYEGSNFDGSVVDAADENEEEIAENEEELEEHAGSTELIEVPPQMVFNHGGVGSDTAASPQADVEDDPDLYPMADKIEEGQPIYEAEVDEINPQNPPDVIEDLLHYPSADVVDEPLLEYEDEDDGLLVEHELPEEEADVTELVVLDPDHPLMSKFQTALKTFLQKQLEKVTLQLREATHQSKKKEQQRESVGVELYGVQQDLARNQMQLEKLRDESETMKQARELAEQELTEMRKTYREKQMVANNERKNNADLQAQVENINMRLFYMENTKDDVRGDIAVMKRAAEKAEADVLKAEENKRIQDLFVDRLNEKLAKLQEDIAMCAAQLAAQMEETKTAKEAVMEARMEIESITIEKKQLFQQWNSSLIGMKRRDEAHAAMLKALQQEQQQILTLDSELSGLKKDVQSEQENNEKLTLIFKKCEDEMNRVRNSLNLCLAKQEEINNEASQYMSILKQTEDALTITLQEKNRHVKQLTEIRSSIEHTFLNKVKLEDEILETMRAQLTSDKAAQNTHKLITKKRDKMKELEANSSFAENEISKLLLEILRLQTGSDSLNKILTQLTDEYDQKNKIISQSEREISQRRNKIKNKKADLDALNKKLSQLKEKAGGLEVSPLQAEVNALQKSIESEQQQIAELQQMWLRDQSELVRLCKEQEAMSESVETLKKELTVLTQKKLRIEGEITSQRHEITEVEKKIHDVQNHMTRLDALIHRETGTEDTLANDNILRENEFMYTLKEAEKHSIEMQERLEALKEEKERLLNSLVEAERQIMLWEKKTQLARETRAAVDMDVGQGEIHAMRAEIHRMQVRETQLKREQEKLVQDLEKTVTRRDIITTRGEALVKTKMNFVTKGSLERQMTDLKKRMKQTKQDISDCDFEVKDLKDHQEKMSSQIDQHQITVQQLQSEADTLDGDVEKFVEQKQKHLSDIISKQQRSKFYQQLKQGKYTRVCKSKANLSAEYQREMERMNNTIAIIDDLKQKFPHAQPSLQKVILAYGSRPDAL